MIKTSFFIESNQLKKILRELYEFLEVKDYEIEEKYLKDKRKYQSTIDDETKILLKNFYNSHNQKLYDLINTNYEWDS